ncbi:MAG: PTS transporter subunit EIIA [Candidatus Anammoximicrobium sp.]|nr:PTS transporter subunit EIIA [Candidatus Anammoximicrobium sp.]
MKTRDLIVDACALLDLQASDPAAAIGEMVAAMEAAGRLKDSARCLADALARHRQHRVGIGGGIAIPHALTAGVSQPLLAIGRRPSGLDYQATDNQRVTLIFLLLVPQSAAGLHLKILGRLAHILKMKGAADLLLQAETPAESLAFFERCGQELGEMESPDDLPRVCVAGAGAGGLAMAAHLSLLGCQVNLFNRSPDRIQCIQDLGGIRVSGEVTGFARISVVSTDPVEALRDTDLVMVVVPAVGHREIAMRLGPHLQDGQVVVLNPGRTGGALEFAAVLRETGAPAWPALAEAQTLLYACRDIAPASVRVFCVKNAVPVAALPAHMTPDVLAVTSKCLPHFVAGDNVLKTGLGNIGAIFHPALAILNAAWIEERHGDFDYYLEGVSPSVAQVLEALDGERVAVAAALGIGVPTARQWLYLSYGASGRNLHDAIQANPGYIGIRAPNRLEHRYLTEDVPMSLVPMASLGEHLGVPVPGLKAFIHLASLLHQRDYWAEGRTVDKLGLNGMTVAQIRRVVEEGPL